MDILRVMLLDQLYTSITTARFERLLPSPTMNHLSHTEYITTHACDSHTDWHETQWTWQPLQVPQCAAQAKANEVKCQLEVSVQEVLLVCDERGHRVTRQHKREIATLRLQTDLAATSVVQQRAERSTHAIYCVSGANDVELEASFRSALASVSKVVKAFSRLADNHQLPNLALQVPARAISIAHRMQCVLARHPDRLRNPFLHLLARDAMGIQGSRELVN